ncbi:MAG TPA: glycosyltransferase [Cyclobacteriaceae bacterium]|nr:glycosyltransferase [Cyclobacteriaceae bacterium]
MTISAYTYVRNGLAMGYPFIQSILSVIDIVDDFVVVLGDSTDGSREAIDALKSPKIRVLDTVWDMQLKTGGKLFAQQSNLGLAEMKGDWVIHIQADEVFHENDTTKLLDYIKRYDSNPRVEGLLFPFLNFRGDYNHIHTGRKAHRFEIRAFRNNPLIRAYRDSQGFRKFSSEEAYRQNEKGNKLRVVKIDVPVFHYNFVRSPKQMKEKTIFFQKFFHEGEELEKKIRSLQEFDYNQVDKLEKFDGDHPKSMASIIANKDWDFVYDAKKAKISLRHQFLNKIEDWTGYRIGEYKNYKLVK